ncbi:uncharacterized protein YpbB [Cytobacillus eiseniae]|uniref:Uncharacterized protein YpbB n=1 Tax=Cytobacillus eiseniae TaxID=762947 RepID=A0ABS4RCU2_9BACI|nr:helix-turn-helix domain-containing protein [Cytobacillus eiseniae]MBP2240714.1 uncharacterized protein YpbB [Cytobacillus eiseniae]
MEKKYLAMIILQCLQHISGERTIYSILHLLNGKKSAQTIQDAHLFKLTNVFSTYPLLTRSYLDEIISSLCKQEYLAPISEQSFLVTQKGIKAIEAYFSRHPIPNHLNGWQFHKTTKLFWERLSLVVQVISQLRNQESKYLPIHKKRELQKWLKFFLREAHLSRDELGDRLYDELVKCLEAHPNVNPDIFVKRLTGFRQIGLTEGQAAEQLCMEKDEYHLQFLGILHYMLEICEMKQSEYPLLNLLIADRRSFVPLTETSRKTLSLLNNGYSLEKISTIRKLKRSTIEDHVVEIALNMPSFDISPFINDEKQKVISNAIKTATSKQLKYIRELVPNADYFEIRLVLAKAGEKK